MAFSQNLERCNREVFYDESTGKHFFLDPDMSPEDFGVFNAGQCLNIIEYTAEIFSNYVSDPFEVGRKISESENRDIYKQDLDLTYEYGWITDEQYGIIIDT